MSLLIHQHHSCRWLSLFALLLALLMGGGCSSKFKLPGSDEPTEKVAIALENSGYKPSRTFEIGSVREVWTHQQTEVEIVMTAPTEPGQYPLIIYLPSLGEDAKAGRLWREAWAKAGYAVFSMQPVGISQALKELGPAKSRQSDDSAWSVGNILSSADAEKAKLRSARTSRESELRYLGHEYFGVDALKIRIEQMLWSYQQLKVRAALKQPLFAAAAFDKVILTGYDLGAQTVAAVLGENFKTSLPSSTELKPVAAIVLSPSVDMAEGKANKRFQALNLPMLVITGNEDNDPYAISASTLRTLIWEASPAGDKFLLSLKGAQHQLLSGSDLNGQFWRRLADDDDEASGDKNPGEGSQLLEMGRNQFGGHSRGGGPGGRFGNRMGDDDNPKHAELAYQQVAAVISSSLAFLDAIVKKDEFSRFWLEDKANHWLDQSGTLKLR